MIVKMDKAVASSSHDLAQRLYDKNIELENKRRKSAQARVPSDPNAWQQMRENFETIILEDHGFSEKHNIEFALWQLHYRRIEEFRAHYSAASATDSTTSQTRAGPGRPDRALKIRLQFKTFLSEATGFYHDLILKIKSKYGLPIGQFYPELENHSAKEEGTKFIEIKKGLISCHRCLIYLGDLARYKGLYGEGESKSRDYAAASSYYLQAASLWPSSGNPHHQLAILATYSGDELMAVYRYFRSLAAENPFSTARDNLIVAFEKNRQNYSQLQVDSKTSSVKESSVRRGRGRGKSEPVARSKEPATDASSDMEKATEIRQTFKAFRVRFVRLNGILFTRTSLEAFEEILSLVSIGLQELLSSGSEEEPSFGMDAVESGLFIVVLVSVLVFTVTNVKGGTEGQSYADIVQNTVLLKDALATFYELMGQLLKKCLQLADPSSSFLLPGILVCMEWIACRPDVVLRSESDTKRTAAQINFWSYCISLFNKLLSAGLVTYDDEDTSCFTDMARYDEGESKCQSALWEDFELRGFLPLQPAHTFVDFSRKHSLAGDSKKDKVARVNRILAAGKVIAEMITIDHKKVTFDSKLKKFVIGVETQKQDFTSTESNGEVKETTFSKPPATLMVTHPQPHMDVEEDDEVIVFRPNVVENRNEVITSKPNHQDGFAVSAPLADFRPQNPVHASSYSLRPGNSFTANVGPQYQLQHPMWSDNKQVALTSGLKGLSLQENGHMGVPGKQKDMEISNVSSTEGITHMKYDAIAPSGPDPYVVAQNMSSAMSSISSKVSTNRPVRHFGPPPGFSSVRPKQVNDHGSALGQNPLNDDYSWLDGYQLQSTMRPSIQPINLPTSNMSSLYMNDSVATSSFMFPGKHVPVVQFDAGKQTNWQVSPNLEISDSHNEALRQQYVPRLDQQGQPIWKGNQFV